MRARKSIAALAVLAALTALTTWIVWDLVAPVHGNLHEFDAHAVARMETAMWRSYYDHHSLRLFAGLATLLRTQYHLPFWRSWLGAYHGARAAIVFQRGRERLEYERALPDLVAFYKLIRAASDVPFDVDRASRLELEWWIVHRQRASHAPGELERALAELQAEIYQEPAGRFGTHAQARAEAMVLRDARAEAGDMNDADWARIGAMLDTSWSALHSAVAR
jgi:hypothetical protein